MLRYRHAVAALLAPALACTIVAGCASDSDDVDPAAISRHIEELAATSGADVGVVARPIDEDAPAVSVGPDLRFPILSTFKVYAVAALLDRVGVDGLDETVPVEQSDIVDNSPVSSLLTGRTVTYRDLCDAALTRSDNTAGNLLLRRIGGPAAITAFARRIGDDRTDLARWEPDLNESTPGDDRDTTTAADLADGYEALLTGDVLDAASRRLLTGWMFATQTSDRRARADLPPGWTTADKTGSGAYGTTNSAGLVVGPDGDRYLLVVLARDARDREDSAGFNDLIADVAAATRPLAR